MILDQIIKASKQDLENRQRNRPVKFLKHRQPLVPPRDFVKALTKRTEKSGIIAEIKMGKPSYGRYNLSLSLKDRVKRYEKHGALAISIVTEKRFFYGNPTMVRQVKRHTLLPILFKDFVIDPYQIHEAKTSGADAIVLIAKILSFEKLKTFVNLAKEIGIEPVIEVQTEEELKHGLKTEARFVAVNARNLSDLSVNINRACSIGKRIPSDRIFLGFSGVENKKDFKTYEQAGTNAVLIGSILMQTDTPEKILKHFLTPTKVKICGIQTCQEAKTAVQSGVDYLGLLFVPGKEKSISPARAVKIVSVIPERVKTVGVFADASLKQVVSMVKRLNLDLIQLHGNESPNYCHLIRGKIPVIKAFRITPLDIKDKLTDMFHGFEADYFLLDRPSRNHQSLPWQHLTPLLSSLPVFLAGGLTPVNVTQAIRKTYPFAVDVSSGVEIKGIKDAILIKTFINTVKKI